MAEQDEFDKMAQDVFSFAASQDEDVQRVYDFVYTFTQGWRHGPTVAQIENALDLSRHRIASVLDKLRAVDMVTAFGERENMYVPAGTSVSVPEPTQYGVEYVRKMAQLLAEETGTTIRMEVGDRVFTFAGDGTYEGE